MLKNARDTEFVFFVTEGRRLLKIYFVLKGFKPSTLSV